VTSVSTINIITSRLFESVPVDQILRGIRATSTCLYKNATGTFQISC